jgi:hypothetical protein
MPAQLQPITVSIVKTEKPSEVVLFDCNCHSYAEAVEQIELAIKCTFETAARYASIAHHFGQATVYKGAHEDCERVASLLGSTGLRVSVV